MNKYVKIKSIVYETNDAITIKFENDTIFSSYQPGQFINVFARVNGELIGRCYSFSSAPELNELPAITIRKIENGLVSGHLFHNADPGDSLLISEPAGRFGLRDYGGETIIFIAGGSGITPLFSMLKTALYRSGKKVLLLYANRDESHIIFKGKLSDLQSDYAERLQVIHFLESVPPGNSKSHIVPGRIDRDHLSALVSGVNVDAIYLCGPQGMMEALTSDLQHLGIDSERIISESFSAGELKKDSSAQQRRHAKISIEKGGEIIEFSADKSISILKSALNQGIKLPNSCQEAMCGTCRVRLLAGEVNMLENYALTDDQLRSNLILLCSGLPVSDHVKMTYEL